MYGLVCVCVSQSTGDNPELDNLSVDNPWTALCFRLGLALRRSISDFLIKQSPYLSPKHTRTVLMQMLLHMERKMMQTSHIYCVRMQHFLYLTTKFTINASSKTYFIMKF